MGLDLSKLENVRHHGAKVIARCPACAETGCGAKRSTRKPRLRGAVLDRYDTMKQKESKGL